MELINNKKMSIYSLSKLSGIPYSTINDICNGKTHIRSCCAETVFRLAQALNITMEELVAPDVLERPDFENYKSEICHRLKRLGDIEFIIRVLESNDIRKYYNWGWYQECFYLLALVDYVSRLNNVDRCKDYNDIRKCKLQEPIYPKGIRLLAMTIKDKDIYKEARESAIPEFLRFNIIENEVRDVV